MINNETLYQLDAAIIKDETELSIEAKDETELLLVVVAMNSKK